MARPQKEIDWADVEKLCGLQCTQEEIAWFVGCSVDTLARACEREFNVNFAEYFAQKRGLGKIALRRAQMQLALKGNAAMLIWLGKNLLNQKDKSDEEIEAIARQQAPELSQAKVLELIKSAKGNK